MYNKIRIDTYYDLTCDNCARSWSTDFDYVSKKMNQLNVGGMGMAMDRNSLYHMAYKAGWKCRKGKTLCPECLQNVE